jgi:hypothetical protein
MSVRGLDLTGQRFGRWQVVRRGENKDNRVAWDCICDCGNTGTVDTRRLVKGRSKSCGCLNREVNTKHGHNPNRGSSSEYNSWHQMKQRCLNPNDKRYADYGGRGIKICERWLDFNNFLEDMGKKPTPKHSIDRIDVDGDYEPSNCKWSDDYEQQRNIRVHRNNKLGVKGVHYDEQRKKYVAQLYANGKRRLMKRTDTLEEAIQARKEAELKYWGKSS